MAVGLGDQVYLWSESLGVQSAPKELEPQTRLGRTSYITSLAFSKTNAILAVGRNAGTMVLWSPLDSEARFLKVPLPSAATHVSFRPNTIKRASQRHTAFMAENEVLLVGHGNGALSIYFVEWPAQMERELYGGWHGNVHMCATVLIHSQQICGISWSLDGEFFATGGNDNTCSLFKTSAIMHVDAQESADLTELQDSLQTPSTTVGSNDSTASGIRAKHVWRFGAAVKAIAFCPWQHGLVAAGGGSNDRRIHFYHTISGACLATIDCAAQVTSLIWSESRREIAATFGFAQPDHPFRIAVYTWPNCQQVVAIPWQDELRALYAIPYPGYPSFGAGAHESGSICTRIGEGGCIVVAGSDGSIKFHEVWRHTKTSSRPRSGLLGGSDILESLHGIDKEGPDTIR